MCKSCKRLFLQLFAGLCLGCAVVAAHNEPHPPERSTAPVQVRVVDVRALSTEASRPTTLPTGWKVFRVGGGSPTSTG